MNGLIDINAVIRMLNTMDRYTSEELTLCDTDKTFPKNEVFIVDDVYEGLDLLPSEPDWDEIMVICDNCGHAIHAKRENCKVSAQPERKGKWIERDSWLYCSECGEMALECRDTNYCPNCGADMRGEQDEID